MTHFFKKAKPIWIVGEKNKAQNDMNMCAEARYTALNLKDAVLTICGASFYQVFVDGMDEIVKISQKSYKQVSRCIKEYLGKTPSQYINDLRLNYAANLIRSTDLSVTDICFTCGFNNVGYFYTSFKNRYSQTPREMRIKANIRI